MADVQMDSGSMTTDELKAKLYQSFRQRGLVDSLKSQLRTKLVNELRVSYASQKPPVSVEVDVKSEEGALVQRAANSLVADHLRRCQYEYSLAVFLPESETDKNKMLTVRDLLGMLSIHPDSQLFRRVTDSMRGYHPKGLLWQLLCDLMSTGGKSHEKSVQVDNLPTRHGSIEKKLSAIDKLFDQEAPGIHESSHQGLQAKLTSLQQKLETKNKEEITREVHRFKENEGKRIELEEREKCRQEVAKLRREMEASYQVKVQALQERERSTLERIQRHQEMVERETYSQRQSLLDELQTLKQKEAELKREVDLNKRAMSLEESRRKNTEENLKTREASLATIEETYEKRFKEHKRQYDIQQQVRLSETIQNIEKREAKLREDQNRLEQEKELQNGLREELKERKSRVAELELLYQQSRYEAVAVSKRNEVLTEKLRDMVDYHSVKEEHAVTKQELHNAKQRLAEIANEQKIERIRHEEALRIMTEKMSQPSPQIVTLQSELQRAKGQLEQERNLLQHKVAQGHATLQEERDHNNELKRQLEDQGNQMREMNSQIADLRQTLRQTQMALSNEIYRKPAAGLSPSSQRSPNAAFEYPVHDSVEPEDHYIDTTLRQTLEQQLLLAEQGGYRPVTVKESDNSDLSPNASLAFLEDTKARFRQLEREAETLEQNYQNFQHRVTTVHALPISPPLRLHQAREVKHGRDRSSLTLPPTVPSWTKEDDRPIQNQAMQPSMFNGATTQASSQPEVLGTLPIEVAQNSAIKKESSLLRDGSADGEDQQKQSKISNLSTKRKDSPTQSSVGSSEGSSQFSPLTSQKGPKPSQPLAVVDDALASLLQAPASPSVVSPKGSMSDGESLDKALNKEDGENDLEETYKEEEYKPEDREGDALRLQQEEEEREEREWEEKHRKQEEERRLREQEAIEREQAMLMELQRQEHPQPPEQLQAEQGERATYSEEEGKRALHQETPADGKTEDDGLNIDPVMQRYMQMIQEKKQEDSQDRKTRHPSSKSDVGLDIAYEMEGAEEPSSTGNVSDDPFDDW